MSLQFPVLSYLEVHYRRHRDRVQAGAPYQHAVDFRPRHQALDVVGLDAAAVQDAQLLGGGRAEAASGAVTDQAVTFGGDFGSCRTARSDGPDRLVSYQYRRELLGGQRREGSLDLLDEYSFRAPGLTLLEPLADAHDRDQG